MSDQLWHGILVAVVEGITEFLPISSTGHMILISEVLGFHGEREKSYSIAIQLGAILAVCFLLKNRFLSLIPLGRQKAAALRRLLLVGVGVLPAFIVGFLAHGFIKQYLFSPTTVLVALVVGAILMLLIDRDSREYPVQEFDQLTVSQALKIGLWQLLALWPGFSRSGATITGGLACGVSRAVAAEFSFVMALPLMVAATGYDLYKSASVLSTSDISIFTVGFLVAGVTAGLTVAWMLRYISTVSLRVFAWYRILLVLVVCSVWGSRSI